MKQLKTELLWILELFLNKKILQLNKSRDIIIDLQKSNHGMFS